MRRRRKRFFWDRVEKNWMTDFWSYSDDYCWLIHITVWSIAECRLYCIQRAVFPVDLWLAELSVNLMNYDARLLLRPSSRDFVDGILTTSNYKFDQYIYFIAAPLTAFDAWCFRLGAGYWPNSSFDVCIATQLRLLCPRTIVDLRYLRVNKEDLV